METRNFAPPERMVHLCKKDLDVLERLIDSGDGELYSWLSEEVGMTDREIRQAGFDCVPEEEVDNLVLFYVEFDNGDSNCYQGDRVPTLDEARAFCKPHIDSRDEWTDIVYVGEVDRTQAEGLWDLSVFERGNWLIFDSKSLSENLSEETMSKRIEVNTILGKLSAEVSGDPNYPGIVICVEKQGEDGKYDKQLALAECTPDHPSEGRHALRLLVFGNDDMDDYTEEHIFLARYDDEETKEIVWGKYLKYLREWVESHNGSGCYGMTPACYEEWLDSEYKKEMEGR